MSDCNDKLATRPILYNDRLHHFDGEPHRDDLWAVTTDELNEVATLRAELAEQKAFGRQLFEEKKRAMELLEAAESESTRLKAELAWFQDNAGKDALDIPQSVFKARDAERELTRLREREKGLVEALTLADFWIEATVGYSFRATKDGINVSMDREKIKHYIKPAALSAEPPFTEQEKADALKEVSKDDAFFGTDSALSAEPEGKEQPCAVPHEPGPEPRLCTVCGKWTNPIVSEQP